MQPSDRIAFNGDADADGIRTTLTVRTRWPKPWGITYLATHHKQKASSAAQTRARRRARPRRLKSIEQERLPLRRLQQRLLAHDVGDKVRLHVSVANQREKASGLRRFEALGGNPRDSGSIRLLFLADRLVGLVCYVGLVCGTFLRLLFLADRKTVVGEQRAH